MNLGIVSFLKNLGIEIKKVRIIEEVGQFYNLALTAFIEVLPEIMVESLPIKEIELCSSVDFKSFRTKNGYLVKITFVPVKILGHDLNNNNFGITVRFVGFSKAHPITHAQIKSALEKTAWVDTYLVAGIRGTELSNYLKRCLGLGIHIRQIVITCTRRDVKVELFGIRPLCVGYESGIGKKWFKLATSHPTVSKLVRICKIFNKVLLDKFAQVTKQ